MGTVKKIIKRAVKINNKTLHNSFLNLPTNHLSRLKCIKFLVEIFKDRNMKIIIMMRVMEIVTKDKIIMIIDI